MIDRPLRGLATAVFTIVFCFLRSPLANLSFSFQRNYLAGILLDLVSIGAVITAAVAASGRYRGTRDPQSCTKHEQSGDQRNHSYLHTR